MPDERTIQIALHLEIRGDEVCGTARSDGSSAREFTGWLGLIATLDAIVAAPQPPEPPGD
ncbi:MAG TPA: hypothetical protein PKD63_08415 [Solirubrobacteraceae bacterium]|nr:hypothetical protein [Solirubrobacteraceae bacterium]